jgi:hypothetical protein
VGNIIPQPFFNSFPLPVSALSYHLFSFYCQYVNELLLKALRLKNFLSFLLILKIGDAKVTRYFAFIKELSIVFFEGLYFLKAKCPHVRN